MQQNVENGMHPYVETKNKTVLEKCKENNPTYRKIRESYFINQLNKTAKGLNKKR